MNSNVLVSTMKNLSATARTPSREIFGKEQDPHTNAAKPKGRILFIGEAVSLAHVGRPAILARWAKEAGYEVHFACGEAYAHIAKTEGLKPLPLHTVSPKTFYARLKQEQFFYSDEELNQYVEEDRRLIRSIRPDWIVGDFRLTAAMVAEVEGIPFLSLQQAHWSPAHECDFPPPASSGLHALPKRMREAIFSMGRPLGLRAFARPLNRLRLKLGLSPLKDIRDHYTAGEQCAYLDLPELNPVECLPRNHFYLGPLFWTPPTTQNSDCTSRQKINDRPLAYVSMGSSGETALLLPIMTALLKKGFAIVASGINEKKQQELYRDLPELKHRAQIANLFNPNLTLQEAALTVCHGGHGTVYQSLRSGVPVLCLPSNPDQQLMGRALQRSHTGISISARISEKAISSGLRAIMNSSAVSSAMQIKLAIQTVSVRNRWLCWLNNFVSFEVNERQAGAKHVAINSAVP